MPRILSITLEVRPEKLRLFSLGLHVPLILFQIQIGCTHKISSVVTHISYFEKLVSTLLLINGF